MISIFQIPTNSHPNDVGMSSMSNNNATYEISLEDLTSPSQTSCEKVPDLANASFDTLQQMAGLIDHDRFLFPDN